MCHRCQFCSCGCLWCCCCGVYLRNQHSGGASSAVRAQCNYLGVWRTRDPYFEILGAPRGFMVTPSGGFDF